MASELINFKPLTEEQKKIWSKAIWRAAEADTFLSRWTRDYDKPVEIGPHTIKRRRPRKKFTL